MTRGRATTFALGVCIGIFLFLFGDAFAELTEEAPTTTSGKFDSPVTPAPQAATTILTRILLGSHRNQSVWEKGGQNAELTSRRAHSEEDGSRSNDGGEESVSRNEEKSDVLVTHASSYADSSLEEIENPTSTDVNRKPRYGEISAESSGKSTSTKAVSERPLRLYRTNELTIATTKPALNDSKQDNKKNLENATLEESPKHEGISDASKTALPSTKEKLADEKLTTSSREKLELRHDPEATSGDHALPRESFVRAEDPKNLTTNTEKIMTVASIGNSPSTSPTSTNGDIAKSDGKKDRVSKSDHKEAVPRPDSKSDKNSTLANFTDREDMEDQRLESHGRGFTTMRGVQHENLLGSRKGTVDLPTTASEAFDLEKIDEKRHDGAVSLINDTRVNYKTQAEKDPRAKAGNESADVDGSRGKGDPKKEVEVVEDMTHQSILKIIDANNTVGDYSGMNKLNSSQIRVAHSEEGGETVSRGKDHEKQEVLNTSADDREGRKSIGKAESQVKPLETTTLSIQLEEQISSTPKVIPSPIPQGRTIEFSGVNEFPSVEAKSTAATRIDAVFGTAPFVQSTKIATQKPYPYVKSMGSSEATTGASLKLRNSSSEGVAEETSAYENTIGKEQSGKKFIVTEASVVLENSIQQQKPEEKDPSEESANFTTVSSSSASATVIPMTSGEIGPTNETFPDKSNVKSAEKDSRSEGADAPTSKSEVKAITGRDEEGYDVTGNGITEVNLPPEASGRSDGEEAKSRANEATGPSTPHSTEMPTTRKVLSPDTDIQTEPEEAMMILSTLVVTESTIVPLDTATEANQSTTSMTPSAIAIENTTESTPKANVTLQQSSSNYSNSESASTTLNPDESSMPTTTSIEFEFVGLTEISPNSTSKGRTFKGQTMPTRITIPLMTSDSSGRPGSTEEAPTTTKFEDSTEPSATTENDPATDPVSTTTNDTSDVRNLPAVTGASVEEQSNRTEFTRNEVTTNAVDFTDAVTNIGIPDVTEDSSASKDSNFDVTETSAPGATELPPKPADTILPATDVTRSPSAPLVPTTEPEVLWNTPNSTEAPEENVTKSIQTLSQDEITLLVKIVIEGTLQEICPRLPDLKSALANVLTTGMDKLVTWEQIVIHQNPCLESTSPSPTPMEVPLTSILVYVVDEDGKFDAAMTKILPSLYKMSHNFPVRIHKFVLVQETDSGNAIAVVVVSSVAFICLVLLAGLLFIMRKRQTRFNYGERCRPVSLDAYSLDSVSAYSSVRRKVAARTSKRSYGNPTFEDSSAIPSHPLNFSGLLSFCNELNPINEEFSKIPQVSVKIDELPPGAELKNRYANVIPLPETRVPLERLNNDAMTEYINASYVRGPKNATKYYIACQAPLESTVTDFWRMIWEQQCKVIIMLTDLVENGVEKCTEYIPPSEVTDCHRLYGDFQVTLKKRETKEKYAISTLHLKNLENNTFREVFHIWYLWPVNGVESDGAGLIAVLLEARALQRGGPGPIVVHCSSGTGRTGTLIALDLGIRQYEITRTVDVPRVVYTIRRDRAGAVQTKEQYAFVYKALNLYATKLAGGVLDST